MSLHLSPESVHISSRLANSNVQLWEFMKMHECYLKQGSLWIIPGSKIPTWSRQWKMPQDGKEYKPTNNVLCSEQRITPIFAGCFTLSVRARVCSEGEVKTSRLLLNQKEGVFLSSRKVSPSGLILGNSGLSRRLQWLQWFPSKAGLVSYREGRNGQHHKLVVHELKVSDYWSPAQSIL